ncbi:hypothetical protein P7K49_013986 [Saguinus oedipus]|uniref:Uncharacterized protein n=1 Tax=Saguinus oedipus TaxID=9490 RepID=A0ABQ9VHI0_SAGOE|nr:hypothetical protein P7K49_013986 [Saguinus oedipus]
MAVKVQTTKRGDPHELRNIFLQLLEALRLLLFAGVLYDKGNIDDCAGPSQETMMSSTLIVKAT